MSVSPDIDAWGAAEQAPAPHNVIPLNKHDVELVDPAESQATPKPIDLEKYPDRWGEYVVALCSPILSGTESESMEKLVEGETGDSVQPALDALARLLDRNREVIQPRMHNRSLTNITLPEITYMKRLTSFMRKPHEHAKTLAELGPDNEGGISTSFGLRFAHTVEKLIKADVAKHAPRAAAAGTAAVKAAEAKLVVVPLPNETAEPTSPAEITEKADEIAPTDAEAEPGATTTPPEANTDEPPDAELTVAAEPVAEAEPNTEPEFTAEQVSEADKHAAETAQRQRLIEKRDDDRLKGGYLDAIDIALMGGIPKGEVQSAVTRLVASGRLSKKGIARMRGEGTKTRHFKKEEQDLIIEDIAAKRREIAAKREQNLHSS